MVAHPLRYEANQGEYEIVVPIGFITDLASIPREFWWWESPQESTLAPAILHDYLYWEQSCTKDEADAVMYLAMKEVGLGFLKRYAVYAGVRTPIATSAWNNNKTARNKGESRFFTQDYAINLMDSAIDPKATLSTLQQNAISDGGMRSNLQDNKGIKQACRAALLEYNGERYQAEKV